MDALRIVFGDHEAVCLAPSIDELARAWAEAHADDELMQIVPFDGKQRGDGVYINPAHVASIDYATSFYRKAAADLEGEQS